MERERFFKIEITQKEIFEEYKKMFPDVQFENTLYLVIEKIVCEKLNTKAVLLEDVLYNLTERKIKVSGYNIEKVIN